MYFENGFACRIRLRNTGPYEQPYGLAPVNQSRNGLFFGGQLHFRVVYCPSSSLERQDLFLFGDQLHFRFILCLSQ